ncbi:TPA_asm: helix-turn-helix domain-containing protein [Listeria monocytogenes]|nr:helix-turn-helix domain-containing protein [Listeria monocytogenes]
MSIVINEEVIFQQVKETSILCFSRLVEELKESIIQNFEDEELLTAKELCERILKCSKNTADKYYLNNASFPFIQQGNERRYPKKAVEKWISENSRKR